MSNTSKINATNGRNCANAIFTTNSTTTTASPTPAKTKTSATTTTTTSSTVEKNANIYTNTKTNRPTTTASATTATTTTFNKTLRREDSDVSGATQQQQHQHVEKQRISSTSSNSSSGCGMQQQHHHANQRDPRKFQYIKPQHLPTTATTTTAATTTENIDECDGNDTTLVYYDGQLISGKLELLIEHMVPTSDYYPTPEYLFAFLLSARLFLRPFELLEQISQIWDNQQQQRQQQESLDVVDEAIAPQPSPTHVQISGVVDVIQNNAFNKRSNLQKSAQNCIRLLADWIKTFPYDFRDERLMNQVRILARKCIIIDTSLGKQVSQILQMLVQRLTALERYEEFLQNLTYFEQQQQSQHAYGVLNQSTTATAATTTTISTTNTHTNHATTSTATINPHATATIGHLHSNLQKSYHQQQQNEQNHTKPDTNSQQQQHTTLHNNWNHNYTSDYQHPYQHLTQYYSPQIQHQHYNYTQQNATLPAPINNSDVPNLVLGIMDICPSCARLAHQLTAIELERLSHIGPEEFVQAFAKEYQQCKQEMPQKNAQNFKYFFPNNPAIYDLKKTRNLESYVEWFNRLSYLTATEIVKYSKKKQRVRVIEYWIETARECFNIGNFNSLMAIIAGLNLAPISRLKKTWGKIQSAKFSVLEHQMDPTANFNSYRSTLKAAMWRFEGATDERERIIIPFFSLFVKDLYFLNESCSNRLSNNHINFEKCSNLAKQVMDFNEWKQVSCPFERLENVIAFLQNSPVLNENTLSIASFECEPPENTEEKGRYKTVKAETKQQLLQQLQEQQQH